MDTESTRVVFRQYNNSLAIASCFCGKTAYSDILGANYMVCAQCGVFATHFSREQIGLGLPTRKDAYIRPYDHPDGLSGGVGEP